MTLKRFVAASLALATVLNSVPAAAQRMVAPVVAPLSTPAVLPGALRLPSASVLPTLSPVLPTARPSLTASALPVLAVPLARVAAVQPAQAAVPA
ncbi:MAG: hypothetical protein FD126_3242, partial [Elusimicrobia bacterium]